MDRKQQNVQVCRTSTGGQTKHGCHSCEAKDETLIQYDTDVSRFDLCSRDSYFLQKEKYKSSAKMSAGCGYKTINYNEMMIYGISNLHFASAIDLYHGMMNIDKMLCKGMVYNVLKTKAEKKKFNKYMIALTNEKNAHNPLIKKDVHSGVISNIRLDGAFAVSVCCIYLPIFF